MGKHESCCHPYLMGPGSQRVPWAYEVTYLLEASGAIGGWENTVVSPLVCPCP